MREVFFHGALAHTFTAEPQRFIADNWQEMLSKLTSRFPTFKRELMKYDDLCILKARPGTNETSFVTKGELQFNFGNWPQLHIGVEKKGSGETAALAILEALHITATTTAIIVTEVILNVAVALALNAVMASLADTPDVSEKKKKDVSSSLFSAPENKMAQGGRVPLIFGTFLVGSYTLSQNIEAKRGQIGIDDVLTVIEGQSASVNIFTNDFYAIAPSITTFAVAGNDPQNAGTTFSAPPRPVPVYAETTMPDGSLNVGVTMNTRSPYTITILADGTATLTSEHSSGPAEIPVDITFVQSDGISGSQTLTLVINSEASYYVERGGA